MSAESYRRHERAMQAIALGALVSPLRNQRWRLSHEAKEVGEDEPDWLDLRFLLLGLLASFNPLLEEGSKLRKRLDSMNLDPKRIFRMRELTEEGERLRGDVAKFIEKTANTEGKTVGISKINGWSLIKAETDRHEHILRLQRELGTTPEETELLFGMRRPHEGAKDFKELSVTHGRKPEPFPEVEPKGDLFVISTHLDCSKRCFPDQGKLVSKSMEATSGLYTGKKANGVPIYSLKAMLARTDKWGYHNFILSGFNCRHHLYPFEGRMPKTFPKEESEKAYEADQRMRGMERRLRTLNSLGEAWRAFDIKRSRKYFDMWERGMAIYESYSESHGTEAHPEWCE